MTRDARLVVNALGIRFGGGLTVLRGLAPELVHQLGGRILFLVGMEARRELADLVPQSALLVPSNARGSFRRVTWEHWRLGAWVTANKGGVLLGLASTIPMMIPPDLKTAVLVQNFAPLNGRIRKVYGGIQRARLEALRRLTERSVRKADITLVFTRYGQALIGDLARGGTVARIPPGLDPVTPSPSGSHLGHPFILAVGDLYRYKGVEDAIAALSYLGFDELHLLICGSTVEPLYKQRLQRLAQHLAVDHRVQFLGSVGRGELASQLTRAKALVQCSRVESLGLPILEGMAAGTPVVATDLPAVRELGEDACRNYKPGDIHHLARLLEGAIIEDRDSPRLRRAKEQALSYRWRTTVERLITVMEEAQLL